MTLFAFTCVQKKKKNQIQFICVVKNILSLTFREGKQKKKTIIIFVYLCVFFLSVLFLICALFLTNKKSFVVIQKNKLPKISFPWIEKLFEVMSVA